jgi:hypothetical protein
MTVSALFWRYREKLGIDAAGITNNPSKIQTENLASVGLQYHRHISSLRI